MKFFSGDKNPAKSAKIISSQNIIMVYVSKFGWIQINGNCMVSQN